MWKPDENLDDYNVNPTPAVISEPPHAESLRPTGEVEVLKPLTRPEVRAKPARTAFRAFRRPGPHQPLWFRRFLAVGSGALVMIALVLVSAILVGINDPSAGTDIATSGNPDVELRQPEQPFSFDVSSPSTFAPATVGSEIVLPTVKRRAIRPRVQLTPYRPHHYARPLEPTEPKFVPTTLIIYSENGVIKTRVEPWLRSS